MDRGLSTSAPDSGALRQAGLRVREQVPLASLGSFQLGGPAACVIECASPAELAEAQHVLAGMKVDAILIGEGTNLLFSDAGWPGVLIRFADDRNDPTALGGNRWKVSAALSLERLVDWAVREGVSGLEPFGGIPGTVGGAVVGNAGAWGVQMEHRLTAVHGWNREGEYIELPAADCGFTYRDSALKHNGFRVSDVVLQLAEGTYGELVRERERILAERAARHPDWRTTPCIGSFFRNLEPTSAAGRRQAAGWFLEQAGAKCCRVGGAAVFPGHANILIKDSEACRADDVAALARLLQERVRDVHGIELIREVRYLGPIAGESPSDGFY